MSHPNKSINSDSLKRRSFVAPRQAAGCGHRYVYKYRKPNMKKLSLPLLFIALVPNIAQGEEHSNSWGIGLSPLYSGIGAAYREKSPEYYSYYSLGCFAIGYGEGRGLIYDCGAGISLLWPISSIKTNKHGLGLTASLTYAKNRGSDDDSGATIKFGPVYSYFFSGIDEKGLNIQFAPYVEYFNEDVSFYKLGFGFGYQY